MFLAHHIPGLSDHLNPHPCEELDVADCALKALRERIMYGESPMDNINHDDYDPRGAIHNCTARNSVPDPYGEHQSAATNKASSFAIRKRLHVTTFFASTTQPSSGYMEEHVHLIGDGTFAIVNESLRKAAQWACGIGVTVISSGIGAAVICQSLWSRIAHQERSTPEVQAEPKHSSPTPTQKQDAPQEESSVSSRSASRTISNSIRAFLKNRGDVSDRETDASGS